MRSKMYSQPQPILPISGLQLQHRPKPYAIPSEWEAHRDTIKKLYLEQNKTLKQVEQTMAKDHKFYATIGMYKKRIKAWGFDKKLKEHEVVELLRQKADRDTAGKASIFFIRGRQVDFEKIRRYVEGKPDILSKLEYPYEKRPSGVVVCRTPSPVPIALPSPPDVRKLEEIMTVLRDYLGACATGPQSRWILTSEGYATRNSAPSVLSSSRSSMIGAWDELASLHLSMERTSSPTEMFEVLDSSLNRLKDAMKDEIPEFIIMLLYLLRFTWPGHPLLLRMFQLHVGELSSLVLGIKHPLTLIWKDAVTLEEGFDNIVEEILRVLYQELISYLGPEDDVVELARRAWRFAPNSLEGMVEVMKQYQNWLASHPDWPSSMLRSFLVQVRLMIANLDETTPKHRLIEAYGTIQTILDTEGMSVKFPISPEEACSLATMGGSISLRLGNLDEAESGFSMAVDIARQHKMPPRDEIISLRNLKMIYNATGKRTEFAKARKELRDLENRILRESAPEE
ncbi:Clr5 domain-containing protein [Annulohypoxylon moriforme]|nr:Clr5 domain-containing protein [Annulohypoxylon moriforme]